MDSSKSLCGATDQDLINLGLVESGHRIALKVFCRISNSSKQEKKNKLSTMIKVAGVDRIGNRKRRTPSTKCVHLGWKHYDTTRKKYVNVREVNGGGTRQHSFDIDASSSEILEVMKTYFFKNGKSSKGNSNLLSFVIGNAQGEELKFTNLQDYIVLSGFKSKTRLYCLTKQKGIKGIINDFSDGSDFENIPRRRSTPLNSTFDERANYRLFPEPSISNDHEIVSVHHPRCGVQSRLFQPDLMFHQVYDWVRGFSKDNKNFSLKRTNGTIVGPNELIKSGYFEAIETTSQMVMSPEVAFKGFANVRIFNY